MYILYHLVWESRRNATRLGADVGRCFLMCGTLTSILWILYPIAWGVCEGGNVIAPDSEAVFYGILDLLAKPVFGALLIFGHRNINPAQLGLTIRDYDGDFAVTEKRRPGHAGGATNGPVIGANDGHVDGTNGHTHGHANGVNGHTNGHVNGISGHTNGVTNTQTAAPTHGVGLGSNAV